MSIVLLVGLALDSVRDFRDGGAAEDIGRVLRLGELAALTLGDGVVDVECETG